MSLSPLLVEDGRAVTALILDITRRKRTEEELRLLSGRLITGREEERVRRARDLHDDVNQRLALISVELERLAKAPGPTAVAPGERGRQAAG